MPSAPLDTGGKEGLVFYLINGSDLNISYLSLIPKQKAVL